MYETVITIVGHVISEVQEKHTAAGGTLATFRVASTERRFDKDTEEWVDGNRLFINVTCWRDLAAGAVSSLTKGDPVVVVGRLHTREYEVDGQRRWSTEVVATAVGPDLARSTAEISRNRRDPPREESGLTAVAA